MFHAEALRTVGAEVSHEALSLNHGICQRTKPKNIDTIKDTILPEPARESGTPLRCWSAGCASGEEPYTLSLIWRLGLKQRFPGMDTEVIATDVEAHLLDRAQRAAYQASSLKALPSAWMGTHPLCLQSETLPPLSRERGESCLPISIGRQFGG
ncbi:MAG: hypothetical protein H6560_01165 [Lewinellaceae bacterium]|nr:hypothetical protein [Lewinellaceae bacterium]